MFYCLTCSGHRHHPGMADELHSLEEIVENSGRGLKLITPLLDEVCIGLFAYMLCAHLVSYLTCDYLYRADICPIVKLQSDALAWMDTVLFYHFKEELARGCNSEDNFWKLILDAWVRTVVTDSDTFLLLLQTLPQALLIHALTSSIIVPVVSVFFASLLIVTRCIESCLPKWRLLRFLARTSQMMSSHLVSFNERSPVLTRPRIRPSQDMWEWWNYWSGRQTRWFDHYYRETEAAINRLLADIVRGVVAFRILGICFGLGAWLRWVLHLAGLEYIFESQDECLSRASRMFNTDEVAWSAMAMLGKGSLKLLGGADMRGVVACLCAAFVLVASRTVLRVAAIRSASKSIRGSRTFQKSVLLPLVVTIVAVPSARKAIVAVMLVLVLLIWFLDGFLKRVVQRQQDRFATVWGAKYKELTFGHACQSCPCPCVQPRSSKQGGTKKRLTRDVQLQLDAVLHSLCCKRRWYKNARHLLGMRVKTAKHEDNQEVSQEIADATEANTVADE
eukprot:TRINITY_DN24728_c0_g1_i1.p1 TRINITY_DN24728_c0_g1~~TRINITY_DN24728_c0_g1_i1.p1  ORF type:complete len:580 (-),score=81.82 TRINITY_DN24728_c0_g1_i1:88-1602(-)